jgi:prepilin peptidase CpaA
LLIVTMVAMFCVGLLALAAWRDVAVRTIPDVISLGLLVAGLAKRAPLGPGALLASMAVALALFMLLVLLHARGLLGGGDVKLAAAFAVGLAPADAYDFVVFTALAGGLLALIYLAMSRALPVPVAGRPESLFARVRKAEARRIIRRKSLPYGCAIALGGASVLLRSL